MGILAKKASFGAFEVGPTPTNLVELRRWSQPNTRSEKDFSTMGADLETLVPGRLSARLELGLYLADPDDPAQDILVDGALDVDIIVYPFGKSTGKRSLTGVINVLDREEAGDGDDGVELNISATCPLGFTAGVVV